MAATEDRVRERPDPDRIACPVCPRDDLAPGTRVCSNCGADLTPLVRLAQLGDRLAAGVESARWHRPPAPVLLAVTAVVALAGFGIGRLVETSPPRPGASTTRGNSARASPTAPMAAPVEAPPPGASPAASRRVAALRARLESVSGIAVGARDGALLLAFERGLFPTGSQAVSAAGGERVAELSRALFDGPEQLSITVEGLTDDQPVSVDSTWPDNWSLGLARAQVVIARLRAGDRRGAAVWYATASPPPDTMPISERTRRRSVRIRVSLRDDTARELRPAP
ncbi:MAG: hypothetical protein OXH69_10550 [Acidobacteria bacterium]|nr:hypothetical protein [Acidobacteriota bacterium]